MLENLPPIRGFDLAAIVAYLGAMAALAVYCGRKNADTDGYFLGGRNIPGWAVGISLIGTSISSVTFIALPAAAISLDWRLLVPNFARVFGMFFAILVFIPLFRAVAFTTAYEFLEARVGRFSRLYCALTAVLFQMIRLGAVLYLVSIPISLFLGVSMPTIIVVGGVFILLYTTFGGIEAVVWTDVAQTFVLWIGGFLVFVFALTQFPNGPVEGMTLAWEADKFSLGSFDWNMAERTFWTLILVGCIDTVGDYASNQTVVQRYMAAKTAGQAKQAVIISVALSIPTWIFFYLIGTTLWALFESIPGESIAAMTPEQVVPWFVMTHLPVGITGLIIAAIMAAAMSSLDSSINAVSAISTTDVIRRYLARDRSERFYLVAAKCVSIVTGLIMIGMALLVWSTKRESIVDLLRQVGSVFGGVVPGIFFVAIFVRRAGPKAVLTALPIAIALKLYLAACTPFAAGMGLQLPEAWRPAIHVYWFGVLSNIFFVIVAVALSYVFPRSGEPPVGPTDGDDTRAEDGDAIASPGVAAAS